MIRQNEKYLFCRFIPQMPASARAGPGRTPSRMVSHMVIVTQAPSPQLPPFPVHISRKLEQEAE